MPAEYIASSQAAPVWGSDCEANVAAKGCLGGSICSTDRQQERNRVMAEHQEDEVWAINSGQIYEVSNMFTFYTS